MSAESVSPITTYFRVHDGLRVRFAVVEMAGLRVFPHPGHARHSLRSSMSSLISSSPMV